MKSTKRRPYRPLIAGDYRERDVVGALEGDLKEAWRALRDYARGLGPQRRYASNRSVMFARRHCYAFVRPKKTFLEVCFFADRPLKGKGLRVRKRSGVKHAHTFKFERADQLKEIGAWLKRAYLLAGRED